MTEPFQGSDILLLHHTGACSGRQRAGQCESKAAPRKIPVVVLEPVK